MRFKAKVIQGWEGVIESRVLITRKKVSFFGDIDQKTGEVVGSDLDIKGKNIKDTIFIFYEGRGSTVGSNILFGLAKNGLAPKLIATQKAEFITISGAIFGEIPMISDLPEAAFTSLKNGDFVRVYTANKIAYVESMNNQ